MRKIGVAASALALLAACATSDDNVADPFDTTLLPRVQLTERVEIRSGDGAHEPLLHQVSQAVVLSTGEIALANMNSEILVFGPDGVLRRSIGRSGGGPGEFRFLMDIVGLDDDRILAWDPASARVTVFLQDGQLDYSCTPQGIDLARVGGGFVGAFGDGSFVLMGGAAWEDDANVASGMRSDTVQFLLFDRTCALFRTIGQFGKRERFYSPSSGYEHYLLDTSVHSSIADGLLLVGENDSLAIARFDSTGVQHSILSLGRNPRPVTEADIEAGWREWVEQRAAAREQMLGQAMMTLDEAALLAMRDRIRSEVEDDLDEAKSTIKPAESLPAYKSIMVGSDGAMWVEDYLSPAVEISRWILMGTGFSPVGWIELEPNEKLLAAGPNTLVVLRKDELDVESVVLFAGDWSGDDQ